MVGIIKDATGNTAGGLQAIAAYGVIAWLIVAVVSRRHRHNASAQENAREHELSEARS